MCVLSSCCMSKRNWHEQLVYRHWKFLRAMCARNSFVFVSQSTTGATRKKWRRPLSPQRNSHIAASSCSIRLANFLQPSARTPCFIFVISEKVRILCCDRRQPHHSQTICQMNGHVDELATISNRRPESKKPFRMIFCCRFRWSLSLSVCFIHRERVPRSFFWWLTALLCETQKKCWKKCVVRQAEQQSKFFNNEIHTKTKVKREFPDGRLVGGSRSICSSRSIRHVINHSSLDAKHRWISTLMASRLLKHMHTVASTT